MVYNTTVIEAEHNSHYALEGGLLCVYCVVLEEFDRIITTLSRTARRQPIMTELNIYLGRFFRKKNSTARFLVLDMIHTQTYIQTIIHNEFFHLIQCIFVVVDGDAHLLAL